MFFGIQEIQNLVLSLGQSIVSGVSFITKHIHLNLYEMIQSYLSLVVILSVVSATYLQTVTLSTTSDFSSFCFDSFVMWSVVCGAYRTDCEQSAIEEHIYKGTKGEYPTEFIKVFYHYSSESCGDDLAFTTQSTGSMYIFELCTNI